MSSVARPRPRLADLMARVLAFQPEVSVEALCIAAGLYFAVSATGAFWHAVIATGDLKGAAGALTAVSLFVAIAALNVLLMGLLLHGRLARPMLTVLLLTTAAAAHFSSKYTVYLDDDMLRNILHTDSKESGELITLGFVVDLLVRGVLPAVLLWRVRIRRRPLHRALLARLACLAGSLLVVVLAVATSFQAIAGLMHTHKDVRHLIAPGNYIVALTQVIAHDDTIGKRPRTPVGAHAKVVGRPENARPRLLVLVVGETVRAQNWGLNGYARQTTPQLKQIGAVNFRDVTACGSATEVSLPCMFAPVGRRAYDKDRIKHSESLLHALEHAGIATLWRDNQSGCKGVCDGLAFESFQHAQVAGVCEEDGCLDEVMLEGLQAAIDRHSGDMVLVLHQLGNHGPAYYKRYPPRLRRFTPACETSELGDCSSEQIVNAYDNAVLHTDDFIAQVVAFLSRQQDRDTAMIYVSDHGESLGENGLFLHGVPYAIAPDTQIKVPMVMWMSAGISASRGIDMECLRREANAPVAHDHLFHSVLGLMQVDTVEYERKLDLFAGCRQVADDGVEAHAPSHASAPSPAQARSRTAAAP